MSVVNKRQLAEIFDVSQQTLSSWQKDGMPIDKQGSKGVSGEYSTASCIEWRFRQLHGGSDIDYNDERARLTKEQADKLERERLRDEGETFTRTEILQVIGGMLKNLTVKFTAIPPKIGPLLVGLKRPEQGKDITEGFIYEALQGVSEPSDMLGECLKAQS